MEPQGLLAGRFNVHTGQPGTQDHLCFKCHAAVPHGWDRRAMLIVAEDPAPYNNGNAGNVAADISRCPAPGRWKESSCDNSKCH